MADTDILTSVWFRVGLFLALMLLIALKFWWSRRKYLREEAERQAERNYSIRSRAGREDPIVRVESDSSSNYAGRNLSPLPPPEFDDAIKYCEKVDVDIVMEDGPDENEPPPSYSEYVKTISAGDGDNGDSQTPCAIAIPLVNGQLQNQYDKPPTASAAQPAVTILPDAENHL